MNKPSRKASLPPQPSLPPLPPEPPHLARVYAAIEAAGQTRAVGLAIRGQEDEACALVDALEALDPPLVHLLEGLCPDDLDDVANTLVLRGAFGRTV
jgi:hypothetical protein